MKPLTLRCLILIAGICWMGCTSPVQEEAEPSATETTFDPGTLNPNAPPETAQFGQLVGIWDITDETIQSDGSWQAGEGAEWIWHYILDGHAIQDDWIAPPRYGATQSDTLRRQYGTNLRIYDPVAQRWDLARISNTDKKLSTFTATAQGDSALVMRGTHASGNDARITFFDMTDTRFEWKLEFAQEDGSWLEVYRIHAVRRR